MRFSVLIRTHVLIAVVILFSLPSVCKAQENKQLEYGILVDSTGSMRSQFFTELSLAKGIVHQIHDHGPVSIFSFDSKGIGRASRAVPAPRIEHTQDEDLLNRTIDGIYVQGGQTTLLDAIDYIAERLNRLPAPTNKVVILLTDGEDRVSEKNQKEVIRRLKDTKTSVYAIGLVQQLESGKRSKAIDLLKSITKETGGRVVFPKSDRVDIKDLLAELSLPMQ